MFEIQIYLYGEYSILFILTVGPIHSTLVLEIFAAVFYLLKQKTLFQRKTGGSPSMLNHFQILFRHPVPLQQ